MNNNNNEHVKKPKEKEFIPDYVGCNEDGEEVIGYSIRDQPDCVTVIVKFYKESEKESAIAKMSALIDSHSFEKKYYIVDSNEFVSEIKSYAIDDSQFNEFDQQVIMVELTDLKTGTYVPVKIIVFK